MSESADLPGLEKPVITATEPQTDEQPTVTPGDEAQASPADQHAAVDTLESAPDEVSSSDPDAGAEESAPRAAAAEAADSETASPEADALEAGSPETVSPEPDADSAEAADPAPPSPEPQAEPQLPANVLPLVAAMKSQEPVPGKVIGWNKGGFHVALNGVPGFCPKSQIEIGNPKRAAAYLDRELPFRIIEVKENGKRIVVSRREILEEERKGLLQRLRDRRSDGQPVTGKVVSITDFGAFVDLGGIEGLVHLSQLSRKRAENVREVVDIGQEVQVKVLKVEKGGERISLSIKALQPDPWDTVDDRFNPGDRFSGKVLRRSEFGLFVELEDGIEGLLHSSQLELGKSLDDYPDGAQVEGWIREAEADRRRLSLSLREVSTVNPWQDLKERISEGDEVTGTVEQLAKFGVFIVLEPGLTGLLPMSSLSLPGGANVRRLYRPGQEIRVLVDSIDRKKRRISLAPAGAKLEGTRADYRSYQRSQSEGGSMNAMEAAFSKLRRS